VFVVFILISVLVVEGVLRRWVHYRLQADLLPCAGD